MDGGDRQHGNPLNQTVQESVKGADGEIGVESKGGGSAEDEEAAVLFLLMTTSRGFAEKV